MKALPRINVVGLGPADVRLLTAEARATLEGPAPLFLRTARHPAAEPYVQGGARTMDHHYESSATFAETYAGIVEELVAAASEAGEVTYAVPGSPLVLETAVERLRADSRVEVRIVPGLSFLDLAWDRLGIDPVNASVRLVDAERFSLDAAGERGPLLVAQCWAPRLLSDVKLAFEELPEARPVLLHHLGLPDEQVLEVDFEDLDRALEPDHLTCCYLPVLAAPVNAELARAASVVRELRSLCPWDSRQTHKSLARHLLEESYEALEAIEELGDDADPDVVEHLEEELGDVLCQVLFHAVIAEEEGWFNLADVAAGLADKLVRRHPHVYGEDADALDADAVLMGWEAAKRVEKGRTSLLEGIPPALPALATAAKMERRVREAGLGLHADEALRAELHGLLDRQFDGSPTATGELLFAIARLVVAAGSDPEEELRAATNAFRRQVDAAAPPPSPA